MTQLPPQFSDIKRGCCAIIVCPRRKLLIFHETILPTVSARLSHVRSSVYVTIATIGDIAERFSPGVGGRDLLNLVMIPSYAFGSFTLLIEGHMGSDP